MKNSTQIKIKSYWLILIILFQTLYPATAMALADNVSQPEFESFEDFNATDMVDLATGDFSYNIPLLNVPSPDGGFQVPLTYHAGIEVNEEASWVGLGWNLNPGSLTRKVSMNPDDYSGENVNIETNNTGGYLGYVKTYPFYTEFYDSQKGKGGIGGLSGIIDIGTGYNKHVGIGPLGLTIKNGKASYNAYYMINGLIKTYSFVSEAIAGPEFIIADAVFSMLQGYDAMMDLHASFGSSNPQITSSYHKGKFFNLWGAKTDNSWYIDVSKTQKQYGALYLQKTPSGPSDGQFFGSTIHNGTPTNGPNENIQQYDRYAMSDMYYYYDNADYANSAKPTSITYDNYNVAGMGVSGSIHPCREDIGSLANVTIESGYSFSSLQFADYKVQFKYHGDYSNSYTYQNMGTSGVNGSSFPYAIDAATAANSTNTNTINYTFTDSKIYSNSGSGYRSTIESNRTDSSLFNTKLVHSRHIEWYTNSDINTISNGISIAQSKGFIDTHMGYNRAGLPANQIAGFSITNEAGMTYHYTIPVYTTKNVFGSRTKDVSTNTWTNNRMTDANTYATAWLLTGITGSDFIDRSGNGIIDDNDWGYWVKFEYGKFAKSYTWRNPYYGNSGDLNTSYFMQTGQKETYYLNRISTRTHSAIFVKDRRMDGKSYYDTFDGSDSFGNGVRAQPSESLKLSDIYVLENSDYSKLISTATGGYSLSPTVSNDAGITTNEDTYENVLDVLDLSGTTGASQFLTQNQLQKIHFNYSYNLCNKTFNSFSTSSTSFPNYDAEHGHSSSTSLSGKLTLESVDVLTKNNVRVMPSYIFKYGNSSDTSPTGDNPNYDTCRWDGNGFYKSGGVNQNPGSPHNCEKKADQWSLTDIITPLGATVHVEYERDDYSNINGHNLSESPLIFNVTWSSGNGLTIDGAHAGATDLATMVPTGSYVYFYYGLGQQFSSLVDHTSGSNLIALTSNLPSGVTFTKINIYVPKKFGGGLRVRSLTTTDEINSYKTKYIYTNSGVDGDVNSSGVASFEPPSEKGKDFDFYTLHEHPYTSIIYSKVTVVDGDINPTFNEKTKTVYYFTPPNYSLLSVDRYNYLYSPISRATNYLLTSGFTILNKTAQIGNLNKVQTINKFGNVVKQTVLEYDNYNTNSANAASMGYYTESTLLWEYKPFGYTNPPASDGWVTRFISTYIVNEPNFLKSITTTNDRMISKTEYTMYDYMTGQPLVTKNTYGGIEKYEDVTEPAYKPFPKMGSKVFDYTNKNMMSSKAATANYVYDQYGQKQLLGGSIQTWQNQQNYRDITASGYVNNTNLSTATLPYQNVWVPYKAYNWKSLVKEDGTINSTDFVPFNWSNTTQNSKWIQMSEATLFDRYSHVLEVKDQYGNASSSKYTVNQSFLLSNCLNSNYTNWCCCGAEDKNATNTFYEGEVDGSGYQFASTTYAHTGSYCSRVTGSQVAFKFLLSAPLTSTYKSSVWLHQYNSQYSKLECIAYDNTNTQIGSALGICTTGSGYTNTGGANTEYIGAYHILNLEITPQQLPYNTSYVIFQVKPIDPTVTQYIYADDFRVHPVSTPITSKVVDSKTGKVLATLNSDNMATKFVYDGAGKLINTYKETKLGFKMTSDIQYNYNR